MTRKKERGQLIVLSGPSGVGKSTVIAELLGQRDNIYFSVSYTTRQPRVGEQNGVADDRRRRAFGVCGVCP